jgi:hypothetical protein
MLGLTVLGRGGRYAFTGLTLNELQGLKLTCQGKGKCYTTGEQRIHEVRRSSHQAMG